jgi:Zn-dependent M16 (insulinase) family peptidase
MGGRFIHEQTGFTLDLLQIQSVPQGFIWVNTFPTSDMGEPHTQEHLLLGKGNKGRAVASQEDMSLAGSSAFTMQYRTCYHFHTAAGSEVYYQLLESQLDALLHPDYTDEEIRREVRNFGITENPADGKLRLEEKGSVYNEMVSSFARPWALLGREINITLYGLGHPLSYSGTYSSISSRKLSSGQYGHDRLISQRDVANDYL